MTSVDSTRKRRKIRAVLASGLVLGVQVVIGGAPQRFVAASGGTDVSGTVTGGVLS